MLIVIITNKNKKKYLNNSIYHFIIFKYKRWYILKEYVELY